MIGIHTSVETSKICVFNNTLLVEITQRETVGSLLVATAIAHAVVLRDTCAEDLILPVSSTTKIDNARVGTRLYSLVNVLAGIQHINFVENGRRAGLG